MRLYIIFLQIIIISDECQEGDIGLENCWPGGVDSVWSHSRFVREGESSV